MKIYKRPGAADSAMTAHHELERGLDAIGFAITHARLAGAHPAAKGILAAASKLRGWSEKLRKAAESDGGGQ